MISIGLDIGKFMIDVCVLQENSHKFYRFKNTEVGHKEIVNLLKESKADLVICEPTGGYERSICSLLSKEGYKVHRVNAYSFNQFSRSITLSKTDRQDAAKLAYYGELLKPGENFKTQEIEDKLKAYQSHREDCVLAMSKLKQRLDHALDEVIKESMERQIGFLKEEIARFDKLCQELIDKTPVLQDRINILISIPGIGLCLARKIISYLPELGDKNYSSNQLAALAGIAPYARDSGMKKGKRFIRGGRKIPRDALYMAVLAGRKKIAYLNALYERITAQGKAKKLAIVAAMRKLLIMAHSLLKRMETFQVKP